MPEWEIFGSDYLHAQMDLLCASKQCLLAHI